MNRKELIHGFRAGFYLPAMVILRSFGFKVVYNEEWQLVFLPAASYVEKKKVR